MRSILRPSRVRRALLCLVLVSAPAAATPPEPDAAQRRDFLAALDAARQGPAGRWQALARGLEDYPLQPWLPYTALVRDLGRADPAAVRAFLAAHDGSLPAELLRTRWLREQAAHGRLADVLADWRPQDDVALRCVHARARIAHARAPALRDELRELWLTGQSLPSACDPVNAWLQREGVLDATTVWRRAELAAVARNAGVLRALASYLGPEGAAEMRRYAALVDDPAGQLARAGAWADTPRARRHVALAVARLARHDDTLAALRWGAIERRFAFEDTDRATAIGAIALHKAASYDADAAAWMARVPVAAADDAVREWRVREALARGDWAAAGAATSQLSAAQQLDPRFRWLRGRLLELQGQPEAAAAAWESLAAEANFHGFLAADRLGRAYRICPQAPSDDAALRARVADDPGLRRAFEWLALDRHDDARREWNHTLARMAPEARPVAVELALGRRWTDRGPLTLLRPDELRYYALRFPLAYQAEVDRHARRHGLDRALVYGLIRAESAWVTDARSAADARGLMQMLHGTARSVARREKLAYAGPNDLFKPPLSIALGTRHLADELAQWGGRAWIAAAAYNAGPAPVRRWLDARGSLPPDLWIETVPYRETREYVARVTAFATLYDWRLGGTVQRVSARIGLGDPARTPAAPVACEPPPNLQAGNR
jgi:soluble lytic murein transglycosylase